jgi:hypothetical protein
MARRSKQPQLGRMLATALSGLMAALWKQHKASKASRAAGPLAPSDRSAPGAGFNTEVVGEASYERQLRKVYGSGEGRKTFAARLEPEPSNQHDADAVRVVIDGGTVCYLPRASAKRYGKRYGARGRSCNAVVVSRDGGYGVWMDLPV